MTVLKTFTIYFESMTSLTFRSGVDMLESFEHGVLGSGHFSGFVTGISLSVVYTHSALDPFAPLTTSPSSTPVSQFNCFSVLIPETQPQQGSQFINIIPVYISYLIRVHRNNLPYVSLNAKHNSQRKHVPETTIYHSAEEPTL